MAIPGPPVFDEETREQILALMAKGASGGLFFKTDDCRASYEELKGRGVEFQQEPTEQPYGIDAGFRDPSGNQMRMVQQVADPDEFRAAPDRTRMNTRRNDDALTRSQPRRPR